MSEMRSLSAGMVFAGDFVVQRALAEGGMGAVYVALQRSTGKERALKVMHPNLAASPASRERFVQEARVGSQIDSDHVVEVVGAGVDAETGMPWLAMELLQGEELSKRLERGPLPLDEAREVFDQLCDALGKAHARGVVHRDLKPENVFIGTARRRGVPFTLKILDFGIAKILKENQTAATVTTAIGSPLWMSPEQGDSNAKLRPATDVWALGLMAFYALTGKVYWRSGNSETPSLQAILTEVMVMPIVPPSQRAAELGVSAALPVGFDEWFMGCVQRDPTQRFTDANVAWTALSSVLGSVARASIASHPSVPATQPLVQSTQVVSQPVVSPTVSWSTTQGVSSPVEEVATKRAPTGLIAGGALVVLLGVVGAAVAMTRGGERPSAVPTAVAAGVVDAGTTTGVARVPRVTPPSAPPSAPSPVAAPSVDDAGAVAVNDAGAPQIPPELMAQIRSQLQAQREREAQQTAAPRRREEPRAPTRASSASGSDPVAECNAASQDQHARSECYVSRLSNGRARTERELAMLIAAERALGRDPSGSMRRYLQRFPRGPRAAEYQTRLAGYRDSPY